MSDLQKKLHAYSCRAEHIMQGFERASDLVGMSPAALETELLTTSMNLELLCRNARRLLLQTSIVDKETLIAQVCTLHDIAVDERDGVVHITLPTLPLKKPDNANCAFITDPLMWCLQKYHEDHPPHKFDSARISIYHCYPRDTPVRMVRDYDNVEVKKIIDILALYFLHDDNMGCCEVLHTSRFRDNCRTEITISSRSKNHPKNMDFCLENP